MGKVKEINIKTQTYYFYNDMIDIRNFDSNLLKIDKKSHKTLIFTIYVTSQFKKLVIMQIFAALIPFI